jgi:hypothetical protein
MLAGNTIVVFASGSGGERFTIAWPSPRYEARVG